MESCSIEVALQAVVAQGHIHQAALPVWHGHLHQARAIVAHRHLQAARTAQGDTGRCAGRAALVETLRVKGCKPCAQSSSTNKTQRRAGCRAFRRRHTNSTQNETTTPPAVFSSFIRLAWQRGQMPWGPGHRALPARCPRTPAPGRAGSSTPAAPRPGRWPTAPHQTPAPRS